MYRTLVIIKPDVVGLIKDCVKISVRAHLMAACLGITTYRCLETKASLDQAKELYAEHKDRSDFDELCFFFKQ